MGKPGKHKWIISEYIDVDRDDFWLTVIAVTGWIILICLVISGR